MMERVHEIPGNSTIFMNNGLIYSALGWGQKYSFSMKGLVWGMRREEKAS